MGELPSASLSALILGLFALVAALCGLESAGIALLVSAGFALALVAGRHFNRRRAR